MAHKGTTTFIAQRASSALLLPPIIWFVYGAILHAGDTYEEMRSWLAEPVTAVMMGALILIGTFHMRIGMNEIIDDYAHGALRGVWKMLNSLVCLATAATGLWSLLLIAL